MWNPLNMTNRQASNLALVVGLAAIAFYAVTGFAPDNALIGVIGTGCIAQRFVLGGRSDEEERSHENQRLEDLADQRRLPVGDGKADASAGADRHIDDVAAPGGDSHRSRVGFLAGLVWPGGRQVRAAGGDA